MKKNFRVCFVGFVASILAYAVVLGSCGSTAQVAPVSGASVTLSGGTAVTVPEIRELALTVTAPVAAPRTEAAPRAGRLDSWNYYYGSVHNHSQVSGSDEAVGTPMDAYTYARDKAKLDFFGLADHVGGIEPQEWADTIKAAEALNQNGKYITFWGFEWSPRTLGHITIVNTAEYARQSGPTATVAGLFAWLETTPAGFAIYNHPGEKDSTGEEFAHFGLPASDRVYGMEIWNKRDDFGPFFYARGFFPADGFGFFDEALARNWRVGVWGGHDDHSGTWGTYNDYRAGLLAKELTREALLDALKNRRMISTADKNIRLYFELGGGVMGSVVEPGAARMIIEAQDGDNELWYRIDLIKNGAVAKSWNPKESKVAIEEVIQTAPGDWYYVRLVQADGNQAFCSPVWIQGSSRPQALVAGAVAANTRVYVPSSFTAVPAGPAAAPGVSAGAAGGLAVKAVQDSGNDGNKPENVFDGSLDTRWSCNGDGAWIVMDLGSERFISELLIAWHKGDARASKFDIAISKDNTAWEVVYQGASSGKLSGFEKFDFSDTFGRYVKIIGHGNTANTWTSILEVQIR